MLSREVMGAFALGVLWVNTLLVAAAAWQRARALLARRARLRGAVRGRVVRGAGEGEALARHAVEQVGRAGDGAAAVVLFHDRRFVSAVDGGVVERAGDGAVVEVAPATEGSAEVWPDPARQAAAAACASAEAFDAAYPSARKARGYARTLATRVVPGDTVWVAGELAPHERDPARVVVRAPEGGALWVSAIDPRPWIARRLALALGFIAFVLAASAAVTALALWPPVFGAVSTLGAALGLGYFLGVLLPVGVALREATRAPSEAHVRGRWARPPR